MLALINEKEHIHAMGDMLSDTVIMESFLEHLFGINAFFVQFSKFSNHFGAILLVSHAEPLAGGVENFASGSVLVDEFVNH